jgi:short subunit dehydrogenase-like uncharacterized protein
MTVAVYGAAGHLGRLVVTELSQRKYPLVLSGRDREKLASLGDYDGLAVIREARVVDGGVSPHVFDDCQVVINCAAPLAELGGPVAVAAINADAHYLDPAGQQAYIHDFITRFDESARLRGVAAIPACGFDYALGDCLVRLTADSGETARKITVAYALAGQDVRHNSLRGAVGSDNRGEVVYQAGRWRPAHWGRVSRARFAFPSGPRTVTRYGSGEVVTVPRHTPTASVESFITVAALSPHPLLTPFFPYLRPAAAGLLRTPARQWLGALAQRVGHRGPPATDAAAGTDAAGTDAADPASDFEIGVVATYPTARRAAFLSGMHTQRLTAVILANATDRMLAPGFQRTGALTPAMAFEPGEFLDALTAHGIGWRRE